MVYDDFAVLDDNESSQRLRSHKVVQDARSGFFKLCLDIHYERQDTSTGQLEEGPQRLEDSSSGCGLDSLAFAMSLKTETQFQHRYHWVYAVAVPGFLWRN